jgi:hypothetical protein
MVADLDERGDQPEGADAECGFLPGQPVVGLVGQVAQDQPVLAEFCGGAITVASIRGSSGVRKPSIGISSREASSAVVIVLAEDTPVVDRVGADVGVDLVGRLLPVGCGVWSPRSRASRAPRSAATQHMSLDEVKCRAGRGPPRCPGQVLASGQERARPA